MSTLLNDIKFGIRMLVKRPGITVIAVIILALGIGANTALYTIINQILLSPLQFKYSERLMMVEPQWDDGDLNGSSSVPDYRDWIERNTVFEELTAVTTTNLNLTKAGDALAVKAFKVTPNFFDVFCADMTLGRGFHREEDLSGNNHVVILSHRLWKQRYQCDPNIINTTIDIDKVPHTVVGVSAKTMGFVDDFALLYVPFEREKMNEFRDSHYVTVLGLLKPGINQIQAQSQMTQIAQQLGREYPNTNSRKGIHVGSLHERLVSDIRPAFLILYGAVTLLLLVACINISNLLVANSSARQREMAIRQALGGGRWRLIRQLLTESLLLGLMGGALGLILAFTGLDIIQIIAPKFQSTGGKIPGFDELYVSPSILGFTLLLSLVTSLVFGILPAWQGARSQLNLTLKETGVGLSRGPRRHRTLGGLVVAQIALAVMLLVGAGLLVKSFILLQNRNPGFNPDGLLAIHIDRPRSERTQQDMKPELFFERVVDQLVQIPGIESAGATSLRPLSSDNNNGGVRIVGQDKSVHAEHRRITSDYFHCLGIPLKEGRFFQAYDNDDSEKVIIVNQAFVEQWNIKGSPLGRKVNHVNGERTIVGVVGNVTLNTLNAVGYRPIVYIPHTQLREYGMTVFIRTTGDPIEWAQAVYKTVRDIDANQPILYIRTMTELAMESISLQRFCTILIGAMAGVALFMALVGLYAVMAFAVSERRVEVGIRLALGAEQQSILMLMIKKAFWLTLIGLFIGLLGAFALSLCMGSLLYEIKSWDPPTFVFVPILLFLVAMLACYVPARKVTKLDPMKVLRYE